MGHGTWDMSLIIASEFLVMAYVRSFTVILACARQTRRNMKLKKLNKK